MISANANYGVHIMDASNSNVVEGNLIGTNAAGTAGLGNGDSGVRISNGALENVIGGTVAGAGNVLSGNKQNGVVIDDDANDNFIEGDLIGTTASGAAAPGNRGDGVLVAHSSDGNVIGGTTSGAQNVISGNDGYGIHIVDSSNSNDVEGNLIGTNAADKGALGNKLDGVMIGIDSTDNVVGGAKTGSGNTIANNSAGGVELYAAGKDNVVEGNLIDANGFGQPTAGLGDGVLVLDTADSTVSNNTIELNRDWAINLDNSGSSTVKGNTFHGNGLGNTHSN